MNRTGTWKRVLPALVVAIGVGIVWGFVTGWGGLVAEPLIESPIRTYENAVVSQQGVPLIETHSTSPDDYYETTYRTLDGQPVTVKHDSWLNGADLQGPRRPPGLFLRPITWSNRLVSTSNYGRPPVEWYLIRDAEAHGRAYFVGYDAVSKLRVGYIGREGFLPSLPPANQQFDVGEGPLSWGGTLCSTGFIQFGTAPYLYGGTADQHLAQWLVFLIDGDRMAEVDLKTRTVRTLYESPHIVSVGIMAEIGDAPSDVSAAVVNASAGIIPETNRLALRTRDRIVVLDPPTGATREYILPESLRDEAVTAYAIGGRQLLLLHRDWQRSLAQFTWLEPGDTVARQQTVMLAGYPPGNPRLSAALGAVVVPVPVGWLVVVGVAVPLERIRENEEPTYTAALGPALDEAWPALLGVWVVGGVLAWLVVRLQRKYWRPHTGIWAAFVLLFGPAALVAYWVEQRRPKLEPCGKCGRIVPRDRDACAACGTAFPAPALVGTEIFA